MKPVLLEAIKFVVVADTSLSIFNMTYHIGDEPYQTISCGTHLLKKLLETDFES
jgi:hypothetical protein